LPENVRNIVDKANENKKHSDYYSKLKSLNDKIYVYSIAFNNKVPSY
jgi:hypothetical protein